MNFVAIDFETADYGPDSACAVALVRVEDGRIAERACRLIRPPRREFVFSYIHGITWTDVAGEPTFREIWPGLSPLLRGAHFLAAHNAPFDAGVLHACCAAAGLQPPRLGFECTVRLARAVWSIYPTKLPDVCRRLRIPLRHHDPASDAEACARIVIAAQDEGAPVVRDGSQVARGGSPHGGTPRGGTPRGGSPSAGSPSAGSSNHRSRRSQAPRYIR